MLQRAPTITERSKKVLKTSWALAVSCARFFMLVFIFLMIITVVWHFLDTELDVSIKYSSTLVGDAT